MGPLDLLLQNVEKWLHVAPGTRHQAAAVPLHDGGTRNSSLLGDASTRISPPAGGARVDSPLDGGVNSDALRGSTVQGNSFLVDAPLNNGARDGSLLNDGARGVNHGTYNSSYESSSEQLFLL